MKFTYVHLVLVLIYAASQITITNCLEWILDDAIHLSAEIETRNAEEEHGPRLPGRCVKLRECYPILFLTDRGDRDEPSSINSDLIDFILETSDYCKPIGNQAGAANKTITNPGDVYVWCRLRSLQKESYLSARPGAPLSSVGNKAEEEGSLSSMCSPQKVFRDSADHEERVVGGSEVPQGEAPYLVVMKFRGKQVCGASIIDENHILTAAHCVSHLKPTVLAHLRFYIGDHDIKSSSDVDHQERNVSKIIYHKEFSADTLHDDIAMIKLSEPIQYTSTVSPICLHDGLQAIEEGNTNGKLVGYGQVEEAGERPATPRMANLRIWKTEECEDVYEGIVPDDIFEKAFCAGGFQDGGLTDACRGEKMHAYRLCAIGDSGGPLTVVRNKQQLQVGIVSFGIGCGRYPGVFTKVSEYQSWIDRHRTIVLSNE